MMASTALATHCETQLSRSIDVPMPSTQRKYADLPWYGPLRMVAALIPLSIVLPWTALVAPHTSRNKGRSMKRILGERAFRYGITNFGIPELQFTFGNTLGMYEKWTRRRNLTPVIDELGDDAKLLWIGAKRVDHVLLYLHGGCFLLPLTDFGLDLWRYVQGELEKQDIHLGIAVLEYSLAPAATFPTPLNQACLGLKFLFSTGVEPKNLQIAGDSAGANLALQLSNAEFDGIDTMTRRALHEAGAEILSGFNSDSGAAVFAEPAKAPASWFEGVDGLVERVLVTAGAAECMHDDIVQVGERLKRHHPNVELVIQEGGLHDDMFLDFIVKEKKLGTLTRRVVDWLAVGYA
ncbi:Alpha/Beta hydrolase protein [Mycena haematopus]|nr:Alpha/Beta hydrolase protein [Mycena haematopus]